MRRFTFAKYHVDDSVDFQQISTDKELVKILKHEGVVYFNYCTTNSISYFVLDVDESYNLDKI